MFADSVITSVAVCAGSGGSVLQGQTVDLLVTGEMSHHQVLDAVHQGVNVILTRHSNSERGFLKHFLEVYLNKHLAGKVCTGSRDIVSAQCALRSTILLDLFFFTLVNVSFTSIAFFFWTASLRGFEIFPQTPQFFKFFFEFQVTMAVSSKDQDPLHTV